MASRSRACAFAFASSGPSHPVCVLCFVSCLHTRVLACLKVDVWSAGVVLYVLLCGFPPDSPLVRKAGERSLTFPSPWWDGCSEASKQLVDKEAVEYLRSAIKEFNVVVELPCDNHDACQVVTQVKHAVDCISAGYAYPVEFRTRDRATNPREKPR